jgi:hypothetical protein
MALIESSGISTPRLAMMPCRNITRSEVNTKWVTRSCKNRQRNQTSVATIATAAKIFKASLSCTSAKMPKASAAASANIDGVIVHQCG